jgi:HAD superfamily hydrolase (TIGR01509 family)
MALNGITTITFDADDTLWDFETGMLAALRRLRDQIVLLADGVNSVPSLISMLETRGSVDLDSAFFDATLDLRRREAIRRSAAGAGLEEPALIDRLFEMYVATRVSNTPIFPETEPTLAILGQRFQLGVITNSNTDPAEVGLSTQFSFAILADSEPFHKPDPRIFEYAASVGGYELQHSVHVGDSIVSDVEGANRAGVTSVWYDRFNGSEKQPNTADYTIASLAELPGLLGIA